MKPTLSVVRVWLCLTLFSFFPVAGQGQTAPTAPIIPEATKRVPVTVPRSECFPVETLPTELQAKANKLLLDLMDSEGLYTVIGGLKPMSSGFGTYKLNVKTPDTKELDDLRRIFATFRCGDAYRADVLPFHRTDEDTRYLEAVFFFRPAVENMVQTYRDFFAPFGITPTTDPLAIALIIEHDPTTARNRGLGYLYGYPKHAVDFFVQSADEENATKTFVERDFFQIPSFARETGSFVYAIPKGSMPQPVDIALKTTAERILRAYRERREKYVGEGKPGIVALLRDWLDNGKGFCAAENASY